MNAGSNTLDPSVPAWLERFAAAIGTAAPGIDDIETLLALAATAARGSARQAAPVACWLAARAGVDPAVALEAARALD